MKIQKTTYKMRDSIIALLGELNLACLLNNSISIERSQSIFDSYISPTSELAGNARPTELIIVNRVGKQIGLDMHPHTLRHSRATDAHSSEFPSASGPMRTVRYEAVRITKSGQVQAQHIASLSQHRACESG